MRVVKKLAATAGSVVLCCAACVLAVWLGVMPLLSHYVPALSSFSSRDLYTDANSVESRFTLLEQVPIGERVDLNELGYPVIGELIGTIRVSGTVVDCDLYYGDSEKEVARGAGIYAGGWVPGENGTVLVSAHTGSHFRDLESAEIGALITIETYYGEFVYEIHDMGVYEATDTSTYDFTRTDHNLILYTCYPFNMLTYTPYRYFVYATPVSGPEALYNREVAQ